MSKARQVVAFRQDRETGKTKPITGKVGRVKRVAAGKKFRGVSPRKTLNFKKLAKLILEYEAKGNNYYPALCKALKSYGLPGKKKPDDLTKTELKRIFSAVKARRPKAKPRQVKVAVKPSVNAELGEKANQNEVRKGNAHALNALNEPTDFQEEIRDIVMRDQPKFKREMKVLDAFRRANGCTDERVQLGYPVTASEIKKQLKLEEKGAISPVGLGPQKYAGQLRQARIRLLKALLQEKKNIRHADAAPRLRKKLDSLTLRRMKTKGSESRELTAEIRDVRRQLAQKDNPNYLAEQVAKYEAEEQKWKHTPTQEIKDIFGSLRSKAEKITEITKITSKKPAKKRGDFSPKNKGARKHGKVTLKCEVCGGKFKSDVDPGDFGEPAVCSKRCMDKLSSSKRKRRRKG
jgi:hypothetical protein